MAPGSPPRVVVVDDHPLTRDMLGQVLAGAGMAVVAGAGTGHAGVQLVAAHRPDLLVLDVGLPDLSGVAVAEQVRESVPEVKILVHTGYSEEADLRALLRTGVQGYLRKVAPIDEIELAALRVVAGQLVLDEWATRVALAAPEEPLSPREHEVLRLAADGLRDAEIAGRLYISRKTVDYHLRHMRRRFAAHSRIDLVNQARQRGLLPRTDRASAVA